VRKAAAAGNHGRIPILPQLTVPADRALRQCGR
jgi:hypothetical protein